MSSYLSHLFDLRPPCRVKNTCEDIPTFIPLSLSISRSLSLPLLLSLFHSLSLSPSLSPSCHPSCLLPLSPVPPLASRAEGSPFRSVRSFSSFLFFFGSQPRAHNTSPTAHTYASTHTHMHRDTNPHSACLWGQWRGNKREKRGC